MGEPEVIDVGQSTPSRAAAQDSLTSEHSARERIQRVMYISIGIGAIVFVGLRYGQITSQMGELVPAYSALAILVGAVMPATLAFLPLIVPPRFVHGYAKVTAAAFLLVHATWLQFLAVDSMDAGPWLQAVNAIPVLIAAVAFHHGAVWLYVFAQLPLVAVTEHFTTNGPWLDAILSGVLSVLFAGLLAGVALALVAAGDKQDGAGADARAIAAREAAGRTRIREQSRINSIVFDEVMSAMSLAAREPHSPGLVSVARSALASIHSLVGATERHGDYTPDEMLSALRAAASDPDGLVEFWHRSIGTKNIPADVVEALSEATAEAVRNSLLHAGAGNAIVTRVVNVTVVDDGVRVIVEDSGVGFNLRAVPARRLGIRVSIVERMAALSGGHALVESRPGRGTTVTLNWRRGL